MSTRPIIVVGGGLAGVEAAYQIASCGLPVQLYEMRPQRQTPAHQTDLLGELVCSNSLKADTPASGHGLLKAELRHLGSLILQAADASRVPAGAALAVDRTQFAQYLTTTIQHHPNITLVREEVMELPAAQITIVATGPLTSPALTAHMQSRLGSQHLYFYDALSPIVAAESIDQSKTFLASRYDVGDGDDYLNCPLDRATYEQFCAALVAAECVKPHAFEREIFLRAVCPLKKWPVVVPRRWRSVRSNLSVCDARICRLYTPWCSCVSRIRCVALTTWWAFKRASRTLSSVGSSG